MKHCISYLWSQLLTEQYFPKGVNLSLELLPDYHSLEIRQIVIQDQFQHNCTITAKIIGREGERAAPKQTIKMINLSHLFFPATLDHLLRCICVSHYPQLQYVKPLISYLHWKICKSYSGSLKGIYWGNTTFCKNVHMVLPVWLSHLFQ